MTECPQNAKHTPSSEPVLAPAPKRTRLSEVVGDIEAKANQMSRKSANSTPDFLSPSAAERVRPFTPNTTQKIKSHRRPSYTWIEAERERHYNLDYPSDLSEAAQSMLDPQSRFYARPRPRSLNLPDLLPYEVEHPKERARFLAHIVAHLYIAICTLDIQGSLVVSAKDVAALRDVPGFSDVDVALETNLFEASTSTDFGADDAAFDDSDNEGYDDYSVADDDDDTDGDADEEDPDDETGEYDAGGDASQYKRPPRSAAVVSVRTWTTELLVWLQMKYDMPVTLRIALAKVYYAICCCRGQHLQLKIYVRTFETLTKDTDFLRLQGLVLDWQPVYNELTLHFSMEASLYSPIEKKDLKLLLRLGERASSFYAPEALPVLFRHLGSYYAPQSASLILRCMRILPQVFIKEYSPENQEGNLDMRFYIAPVFYMWKKWSKCDGVDIYSTSILGRLSLCFLKFLADNPEDEINYGSFGLFTPEQFSFLTNSLLNSLSINAQKFGTSNTKQFHGFSCAIVSSMNGPSSFDEGGIFEQLGTIVNAIESYVHPSNTGEWSKPICQFISSLVYQIFRRYNMERERGGVLSALPDSFKLSDAMIAHFVEMIFPLVRTGLQSKKESTVAQYLASLALLAHLDSNRTLGFVLLDIYESLEGVISTHRVITALKCMEELSRYFAATPLYRVHLPRLLEMILPGIDSNDLTKTIHTLDVFATVSSFVPLTDLTSETADPMLALDVTNLHLESLHRRIYDAKEPSDELISRDTEIDALKSASSIFQNIFVSFAQRLFILFENLPDPSKSSGIEKHLCEMLPKLVYMVLEAMSDEIFRAFRKEVVNFITENTIYSVTSCIAELCGCIIKRDPLYFKSLAPVLIDRIREEINENGAGKSRTGTDIIPRDQRLFWNLMILNSCVGNAGGNIVDMGEELNSLSIYLMQHVKGPTVFASTYLLNQILQGVTKIRLNESRLISPAYTKRHKVDENCWGGFQFDEYRFSKENLSFDWFCPNAREIEFAVNTFKTHTRIALSNISTSLKEMVRHGNHDNQTSLALSDEIRANFLYLGYGLSGMSYLFDPSFNEDIPKLGNHKLDTLQNRLTLLSQIRKLKSSEAKADDPSAESVYTDLANIVKDMENFGKFDWEQSVNDIIPEGRLIGHIESRFNSSESLDISESRSSHPNIVTPSDPPTIEASARASPQLAGFDLSTMSPAATFRERRLYTSKYQFGDDIETRNSSESYLLIHRIRHLVGKSLHSISKFMQSHLPDNTNLYKHFLTALKIWFADVGRERLLDYSHARLSLEYIKEVQSITRVRKPFTRLGFGSRLESYHSLRTALHATSRSMITLDKVLLKDLVSLSCSPYSSIAEAAQSTLTDSMKRINGSYGVIVRSCIHSLGNAIKENRSESIQNGLRVFEKRSIKNKLQNDLKNLPRYIKLLQKCYSIDDKNVSETAYRCMNAISGTIHPARSVCLIDSNLVDAIRPPEHSIDLEIRAVTQAKEIKRVIHLERLDKLFSSVMLDEQINGHWKTSETNLSFLIAIQADFEVEPREDMFDLLAKSADSDHPVVSRTALRGIFQMLNKFETLSVFDNQLKNVYNIVSRMKTIKAIDTRPHENKSYVEEWRKEVYSETPTYFVDRNMKRGWLFWDDEAMAVACGSKLDFDLSQSHSSILRHFCKYITKDWLKSIINLWVAENDFKLAFQVIDVSLVRNIVSLICDDIITTLTLRDFLDLIQISYDKDEKSCHIVICELIAGLLLASKNFNKSHADMRDEFVVEFLRDVFEHDVTPETRPIWRIFAWWVPAHMDSRRIPRIRDLILRFQITPESDAVYTQAAMLAYASSFVSTVGWATPNPYELIDHCFKNATNRYEAIREQVALSMGVVSYILYYDSFPDARSFIEASCGTPEMLLYQNINEQLSSKLMNFFSDIDLWRDKASQLSTQDILKSEYFFGAATALSWLKQAFSTNMSAQYQHLAASHFVPFLVDLLGMKDVCLLGNLDPMIAFKKVSQILFEGKWLQDVIAMLERYMAQDLSLIQYLALGEFTEVIYFKNLFRLNLHQRYSILNFVNSMIYHKNPDIRKASSSTFAGLIYTTPPNEIKELVKNYNGQYSSSLDKVRRRHKENNFKYIPAEDVIILHGATLGLGALVHAFSFISPPPSWIPETLTILSNKASGLPGLVGQTAKDILGKFKKTRQDSWHIDSKVFTEEQMQDLEGVLWRSYFI